MALAVAALLVTLVTPSQASPAAMRIERHGSLLTWSMSASASDPWCTQYANGHLAGWIGLKLRQDSGFPSYQWQYTFGPWAGSYCSNAKRIWGIAWGGQPDAGVGFGWTYYPGDTYKNHLANTTTYAARTWHGHFSVEVTPLVRRDDYPWLRIELRPNQDIRSSKGCDGSWC
jgi:hypothetical protein